MRKRILVLIVALALLTLSACSRASVAQSVNVAQGDSATNACPTTTDGTQLLMNEAHDYCLLYPVGYDVYHPSETGVSIVVGSLMNHTEPSASIQIEKAAGRTVGQAVEELMVQFNQGVGFDIKRSSVTVGGEEGVVLDNMPGQDLHRRVAVVHDGTLYWLHFMPLGADYGEVGTRTEVLYTTVIDSFRFLPGDVVVPQGS